MKKRFTIGGALVGLLCGGSVMVFAYIKGPGQPGILELLLQATIVGVFVSAGALLGLFVGWLISLCIWKK